MFYPLEDLLPRTAFLEGKGFELNWGWNVAFLGLCKCIAGKTAAGAENAVQRLLSYRVLGSRMWPLS